MRHACHAGSVRAACLQPHRRHGVTIACKITAQAAGGRSVAAATGAPHRACHAHISARSTSTLTGEVNSGAAGTCAWRASSIWAHESQCTAGVTWTSTWCMLRSVHSTTFFFSKHHRKRDTNTTHASVGSPAKSQVHRRPSWRTGFWLRAHGAPSELQQGANHRRLSLASQSE